MAVYAAVGVLVLALYTPVFLVLASYWFKASLDDYDVYVPFISLGVLWWRWPTLRRQPIRPSARGALVLAAGLALYLLGQETGVRHLQGVSLIPVVLGLLLFLWGPGAARVALFPVAYCSCSLGLFNDLAASPLPWLMQTLTAHAAVPVADLLGTHTTRVGLILSTGNFQVVVADACSGFAALRALLALGWLLVALGPGTVPTKVVLGLAILPLVMLANIVRVALVLVIATHLSRAIAEGFIHSLFSVLIFVLTVGTLLLLRKGLVWLDRSVTDASRLPSSA